MGIFKKAISGIGQILTGGNYDKAGSFFNDITGATSSAKMQFNNQLKLQENAQNFAKWQMANAHQMEVKDLEAAGLNPVLSAGGGGASANVGGGTASAGQASMNPLDMIMGLMTTAKGVEKTNAEIRNIDADTNQKNETTNWMPKLNQSVINYQQAQIGLTNATTGKAKNEAVKVSKETEKVMMETLTESLKNAYRLQYGTEPTGNYLQTAANAVMKTIKTDKTADISDYLINYVKKHK